MGKTLETLEPGQPICHHKLLHRCRHTSTPPSAKMLSPAFQRESMSRSVHRFGHKKPPKAPLSRINKCSFTSPCLSYKCISNILDQIGFCPYDISCRISGYNCSCSDFDIFLERYIKV
ncbi:aifB [Gossypium arboreum]|uniref:AifB n=1 Tax=Gossypium arboreum TaxID=29729 RepID=A0A0B0MU76_GOSAR|nr:aifB [Gossypium arboreum]KHG04411.1 aifB [Gossypium arboreum]